jgi:3-phosphoglycerate kinase
MMLDLRTADLAGKRVLYRADYNVPMQGDHIEDPYRITESFATLDFLIERGAKIIIVSHLGRPDGHEVPELSLRPIAAYLADHYDNHNVHVAHKLFDPAVTATIDAMRPGDMMVLPNIRFFAEEEQNASGFARNLAEFADVFVLDAFACAHRAHASIVGPAQFLPAYPGFLLQKEMDMLGGLLESPQSPFVVIMGGAKVSDKIGVIKTIGAKADKILIGGAMANTFLLAQGENIGASKAEPDQRGVAENLLHEFGSKLFLAPGYVKEESEGTFRYLDIDTKSVEFFKTQLADAKTIFWNGSLGYTEDERYAAGSATIAQYLAERTDAGVTTIVAGGDTVEMISSMGIHDHISFVSTGGGAALELLEGTKLPGVAALESAAAQG